MSQTTELPSDYLQSIKVDPQRLSGATGWLANKLRERRGVGETLDTGRLDKYIGGLAQSVRARTKDMTPELQLPWYQEYAQAHSDNQAVGVENLAKLMGGAALLGGGTLALRGYLKSREDDERLRQKRRQMQVKAAGDNPWDDFKERLPGVINNFLHPADVQNKPFGAYTLPLQLGAGTLGLVGAGTLMDDVMDDYRTRRIRAEKAKARKQLNRQLADELRLKHASTEQREMAEDFRVLLDDDLRVKRAGVADRFLEAAWDVYAEQGPQQKSAFDVDDIKALALLTGLGAGGYGLVRGLEHAEERNADKYQDLKNTRRLSNMLAAQDGVPNAFVQAPATAALGVGRKKRDVNDDALNLMKGASEPVDAELLPPVGAGNMVKVALGFNGMPLASTIGRGLGNLGNGVLAAGKGLINRGMNHLGSEFARGTHQYVDQNRPQITGTLSGMAQGVLNDPNVHEAAGNAGSAALGQMGSNAWNGAGDWLQNIMQYLQAFGGNAWNGAGAWLNRMGQPGYYGPQYGPPAPPTIAGGR